MFIDNIYTDYFVRYGHETIFEEEISKKKILSNPHFLLRLYMRYFLNYYNIQQDFGANTKNGSGLISLSCSTVNAWVPRFPNHSRFVNKVCSQSWNGACGYLSCVCKMVLGIGWVKSLVLGHESSEMFWGWSDQDFVWWVQGNGGPWHGTSWDVMGHCDIHTFRAVWWSHKESHLGEEVQLWLQLSELSGSRE